MITTPIKNLFKNFNINSIFVCFDYAKWEKTGKNYYYIYARDKNHKFPSSRSYRFEKLTKILKKYNYEI